MELEIGATSIEKIPKISASGQNFLNPLPLFQEKCWYFIPNSYYNIRFFQNFNPPSPILSESCSKGKDTQNCSKLLSEKLMIPVFRGGLKSLHKERTFTLCRYLHKCKVFYLPCFFFMVESRRSCEPKVFFLPRKAIVGRDFKFFTK